MALAESAHVMRQRGAELARKVDGSLTDKKRIFPNFLCVDGFDGLALIVHLRHTHDTNGLKAIADSSKAFGSHRKTADMALRLIRLETKGHTNISPHEVDSIERKLGLGPISEFGRIQTLSEGLRA